MIEINDDCVVIASGTNGGYAALGKALGTRLREIIPPIVPPGATVYGGVPFFSVGLCPCCGQPRITRGEQQ